MITDHSLRRVSIARRFEVVSLILTVLWGGILIGVSFVATPAKFLAPSLTLPVALDVGRHTFAVSNPIEWGAAGALFLSGLASRTSWQNWTAWLCAIGILGLETFWLLPILDARVSLIIAGEQPPPTSHHAVYIACEVCKFLALLISAILFSRGIVGHQHSKAFQR